MLSNDNNTTEMRRNRCFLLLLNNLVSADPTLGEELYSRYFLIDIIPSSTKDIRIKRKRIPRTSLNPIAYRGGEGRPESRNSWLLFKNHLLQRFETVTFHICLIVTFNNIL